MTRTRASQRNRLYRSTTDKVFLGVCGGLADYFDFNPAALRILAVVIIALSSFLPGILVYVVVGMVMKPAPVRDFSNIEEEEFFYTIKDSPTVALQRVRHRFDQLDRRLQRMETIVTSRRFELEQEYKNL
jgi:phage shock protein C